MVTTLKKDARWSDCSSNDIMSKDNSLNDGSTNINCAFFNPGFKQTLKLSLRFSLHLPGISSIVGAVNFVSNALGIKGAVIPGRCMG